MRRHFSPAKAAEAAQTVAMFSEALAVDLAEPANH